MRVCPYQDLGGAEMHLDQDGWSAVQHASGGNEKLRRRFLAAGGGDPPPVVGEYCRSDFATQSHMPASLQLFDEVWSYFCSSTP
jgi:hypothetical protein